MRNLRYFWIKRTNISFSIFAAAALIFTFVWLSARPAVNLNSEIVNHSFPIALNLILFSCGSIALLCLLCRFDLDAVLPQSSKECYVETKKI